MVLKRFGVLSVGKMMGAVYVVIGILVGAFFALFTLLGASLGRGTDALPGAGLGIAAIVLFPIIYGVMGFIGGILMAALYNAMAGVLGGIELEFENPAPPSYAATAPQP